MNIINDQENIPELIQSRCTVNNIGKVFNAIVSDQEYRETILNASRIAIDKLGTNSNPSALAAEEVLKIVNNGQ